MWKADQLLNRLYEEAVEAHRAAAEAESRESRRLPD